MCCTHSYKLVGSNSMICSFFNFCPQSAPRGGAYFGGLSPQTKLQSSAIENFLATVLSRLVIHLLPTRSPILPKLKII